MIYNFNLGIGWASSGVEFAQAYRANVLRRIGQKAKFIFTDMFPRENIEHMTKNMGFEDAEIIWLYGFFTDCRIAPVSFTQKDLEAQFAGRRYTKSRTDNRIRYQFADQDMYYTAYLASGNDQLVHRVEIVSRGKLIRKDYYTYCKIYSEYYAPFEGKAHLYLRRYFNEDQTIAYEEMIDEGKVMYRFPDKILDSKEALVGEMVSRLGLTEKDVVILDRTTGIGQAVMRCAVPAKIGVAIHADHFSEASTNEDYILWNNYYEYSFSQCRHVDFYLTATEAQKRLLTSQFQKYCGVTPKVVQIPVGSLDELKYREQGRKKHAFITASRLAGEKHVDWLVMAAAEARKKIPDLTLDIYGEGGEEKRLRELIGKLGCGDYVRLCGQQNLTEVYQNYEAYVSASTSEGFGLSLMEAVGSGLAMIGFDVRYGNQTFIRDGKNGYLIPEEKSRDGRKRSMQLAERMIRLCLEADIAAFRENSYKIAEEYLTEEVEKKWKKLLQELLHCF